MSIGPLQLALVVLLVVVLFGTKKLGNIGSDLAKAIRGFKKGMSDDDKDKHESDAQTQSRQSEDGSSSSGDASGASAKSPENDSNASSHKPSDH